MTLGSLLIFGGNIKAREARVADLIEKVDPTLAKKENPDLLIIKKPAKKNNIGIGESRKITKFLSTKPYSARAKVVVIYGAHTLTTQAQNALLKTLEEPPKYALIILSAKTENSLIPTVISRCKRLKATISEEEIDDNISKYKIEDIKGMDIGEKLNVSREIAKLDKDEVIYILEDLVAQERQIMLGSRGVSSLKFIKKALEIKKDLEDTNVNTRLAVENVLLALY